MALIIKVDGTRVEVQGTKPNGALTYEQLKEAVGGGYIQAVACDPAVTGGYDHLYCDEEGKLKDFPINREATKLSTYTMPDDVLVGDIIFCKTVGKGRDEDA
jgi:hypothetical protein